MNDDPTQDPGGTEHARLLLAQSETALSEALMAFDLTAQRLNSGEAVPPADIAKAYSALSQARTKLINEVKEHDKRVLRAEGRDAETSLDLEAIRVEIGRRLDRIRSGLDEKGLSGLS